MKLFLIFFSAIFCLFSHSASAEGGIEEALAPIFEKYNLSESNFSMGYYNSQSGEYYLYNGDKAMVAGSLYKLPICLTYEEMLDSGEITGDTLVGGYSVDRALEYVLELSNNEIAQSLQINIGGNTVTRPMAAKYYGLEDGETLPEVYLTDNVISARYGLNMMMYIYANSDSYDITLGHMKNAQTDLYAARYLDCEVAHKYGYFEGYLNDIAIVYSRAPFMMSVCSYYVSELCMAELYLAAYEYTEEQYYWNEYMQNLHVFAVISKLFSVIIV